MSYVQQGTHLTVDRGIVEKILKPCCWRVGGGATDLYAARDALESTCSDIVEIEVLGLRPIPKVVVGYRGDMKRGGEPLT